MNLIFVYFQEYIVDKRLRPSQELEENRRETPPEQKKKRKKKRTFREYHAYFKVIIANDVLYACNEHDLLHVYNSYVKKAAFGEWTAVKYHFACVVVL